MWLVVSLIVLNDGWWILIEYGYLFVINQGESTNMFILSTILGKNKSPPQETCFLQCLLGLLPCLRLNSMYLMGPLEKSLQVMTASAAEGAFLQCCVHGRDATRRFDPLWLWEEVDDEAAGAQRMEAMENLYGNHENRISAKWRIFMVGRGGNNCGMGWFENMFLQKTDFNVFLEKLFMDSPFAYQGLFCLWIPPLVLLHVQVGRIQSLSEFRPLAVKGWGPSGHALGNPIANHPGSHNCCGCWVYRPQTVALR